MSRTGSRVGDSQFSDRSVSDIDETGISRLSDAHARARDEAGAMIARQLNGPLTALLLYMGEIKQQSQRFSRIPEGSEYLQKVVDNALLQTERVCDLVKQIAGAEGVAASARSTGQQAASATEEHRREIRQEIHRPGRATSRSKAGLRSLTRREREVLKLISEGCSNKEGALQMRISPRTFESHRAEAMRKLGARNTADLVRAALLDPID